jgi:hypothetical protein
MSHLHQWFHMLQLHCKLYSGSQRFLSLLPERKVSGHYFHMELRNLPDRVFCLHERLHMHQLQD